MIARCRAHGSRIRAVAEFIIVGKGSPEERAFVRRVYGGSRMRPAVALEMLRVLRDNHPYYRDIVVNDHAFGVGADDVDLLDHEAFVTVVATESAAREKHVRAGYVPEEDNVAHTMAAAGEGGTLRGVVETHEGLGQVHEATYTTLIEAAARGTAARTAHTRPSCTHSTAFNVRPDHNQTRPRHPMHAYRPRSDVLNYWP